ncbi:hypothetical protein ACFHYN_02750 [Pasteurella multocida]|uniref:hypothetical protein n=1 Tax=Pasteurella multocida TaxID=747 RepID=UPI0035F26D6B
MEGSTFTPPPQSNGKARYENSLISDGSYEAEQVKRENEAKANLHNRKEEIRDELHCWILWFIRLFLGAAAVAGVVYFYHMIVPEKILWCSDKQGEEICDFVKLHFLSPDKLDKVSSFFVTVVLSGTFAGYTKKFFKDD